VLNAIFRLGGHNSGHSVKKVIPDEGQELLLTDTARVG